MANVRIAQKLWEGSAQATEWAPGRGQVGLQLPWVEIDGHRIDHVVSAEVRVENGINIPTIEVAVIGTVEMVYLTRDQNEHPVRTTADEVAVIGPFGSETWAAVRGLDDLDRLALDRDQARGEAAATKRELDAARAAICALVDRCGQPDVFTEAVQDALASRGVADG